MAGTPVPGEVLCLGEINADFQLRVPRRPDGSANMPGSDFARHGGGRAANVAFFCARQGLAARLFGHVGDDDLAHQALAPLRDAGVDLAGMRAVAGCPTGVSLISVPPDGSKSSVAALNANDAPWSCEDHARLEAALAEAPPHSVLVADAGLQPAVLERALARAGACGLRVVLDPSPAERITDALLARANIVVPNAAEASALTGIACSGPEEAAQVVQLLRARGAAAACVKLPGGGCFYADAAHAVHITAPGTQVVDTTGAGDAFAGALAAALASGRPQLQAVAMAVAASWIAVRGYGAQASYPDAPELEAATAQVKVGGEDEGD